MFTAILFATFVGTIALSFAWTARPAQLVHPF